MMMEQKRKQNLTVNTITDIMRMRFSPEVIAAEPKPAAPEFMEKIKSIIHWEKT